MADQMFPPSFADLTEWIVSELEQRQTIFGLPQELFYRPRVDEPFSTRQYGHKLQTPLGVAAGPHTQLTQNIVCAYLMGARFIELKTVQTLDELEVSKPCIDMEDVGYNCEWSQELQLPRSFEEYLRSWILLYGLQRELELGPDGSEPGFLFNMSVGYNLEGIHKDNVQQFLAHMADAADGRERLLEQAKSKLPALEGLDIPGCLSDSITLSTMHGCPPDEIERIARYLIEERGMNTSVKLNPTLLGPDLLREILHGDLGFDDIEVPDEAFEHDPKFTDALAMIRSLVDCARAKGVFFGVKLTNTLETRNVRKVLPENEPMHYMSGRALHPLAVQLASKLAHEFEGHLPISMCGGADAFNLSGLYAAGLSPITVCSDLLRPGGYGRLPQYLERLRDDMRAVGALNPDDFICRSALADEGQRAELTAELADSAQKQLGLTWDEQTRGKLSTMDGTGVLGPIEQVQSLAAAAGADAEAQTGVAKLFTRLCTLRNLDAAATRARSSERYRKPRRRRSTKGSRPLGLFDCISAPCREACPAHQNAPDYLYLAARGRYDEALEVILRANPLPSITGAVCDHPCMSKCVRSNYDRPVAIREVKRFIAERAPKGRETPVCGPAQDSRVAVIGAGPAGLAAAWYLALAGVQVTVFDGRAEPGGIPAQIIPAYRLSDEILAADLEHVRKVGVKFRFATRVGQDISLDQVRADNDYLFIGSGAQQGMRLAIEGEELPGVFDCMELLADVRSGKSSDLGNKVLVIGGGNSAMDAARTARRLVGAQGQVELVYRRTEAQMPADDEELEAIKEEGISIRELHSPTRVVADDSGRVSGLECVEMELGESDKSGRPRPVVREGSEKVLPAQSVVVAVGQQAEADLLEQAGLRLLRWGTVKVDPKTFETSVAGVFAGGDVVHGGGSIIQAIADAHKAVSEILRRENIAQAQEAELDKEGQANEYLVRKSRRAYPDQFEQLDLAARGGFNLVSRTLTEEQAVAEAGRCLDCDEFCSLCVTVCPNRANHFYTSQPVNLSLARYMVEGQKLTEQGALDFQVGQYTQIVNLADWCNECGNCASFCPSQGAPYRDKPRLCFSDESFAEEQTAYRLRGDSLSWVMEYKAVGQVHELQLGSGKLSYRSPLLLAQLEPSDLHPLKVEPGPEAKAGDQVDLAVCASMFVLARSLVLDASFLPGLTGQ